MFWFLLWVGSPPSAADTVTLVSGTALEAELVVYQYEGNCQLSVTGGDLAGTILVTPCADIQSFTRSPPVPPSVVPLLEDEAEEPLPKLEAQSEPAGASETDALLLVPQRETSLLAEDSGPASTDGGETSPPRQPVAIATLPPGMDPPGAFLQEPEAEFEP